MNALLTKICIIAELKTWEEAEDDEETDAEQAYWTANGVRLLFI